MLYFIQMIGIHGSGKSKKAKELADEYNAVLLSSDELRRELLGDSSDQSDNNKVFSEMFKRTKKSLEDGRSVIYDATNINYKRRKELLKQLKSHFDITAIAVVMATPLNLCINRQSTREYAVSEDVIMKMLKSFYVPYWYEGWDDIEIVYPNDSDEYEVSLFKDRIEQLLNFTSPLYMFKQHNPHHKLTLGLHLYKCYELCKEKTEDTALAEAALLHDIGKVMTQEFDESGLVAHYKSHHHVSAYFSLFERNASESHILRRAAFIQWHMSPYNWREEKTMNKYLKLFGDEFYQKLLILHECDKNAH